MNEADFSVALHFTPHRSRTTLFVFSSNDGNTTWSKQLVLRRNPKLHANEIDEDEPFERVTMTPEVAQVVRWYLSRMVLPALPSQRPDFGGPVHELTAHENLILASWSWWATLPDEWAPLAPLVAYLKDPSASSLQELRGAGARLKSR